MGYWDDVEDAHAEVIERASELPGDFILDWSTVGRSIKLEVNAHGIAGEVINELLEVDGIEVDMITWDDGPQLWLQYESQQLR